MKTFITIACFFTIMFASAQSIESNDAINEISKELDKKAIHTDMKPKTLVISVKGVKKIEDLDIENFNKNAFLNLIASKKIKNNIC
jgi:hypothetical protein